LPTDRFSFEGFLPRKPGERRALAAELATERRTMVFFESPARLAQSLGDLGTGFGADRRAAVCRELTKKFEEVRRGSLAELAEWAEGGVRGEIALVIEGAPERTVSSEDALAEVLAQVAAGARLKDASREVAAAAGLSGRELYQLALAARR
ncbi:16S rRNA (cytidine(1402)-2'-O)-methyltransferase, partial [Leucobacter sp. M11]|uniref:16S rRNA (cytidine(1402)-2'-O)-methyltransferase n=1 Tax=Leucobacter sp. M11 TaxID=2993565 RepID=UPI002D7F481C